MKKILVLFAHPRYEQSRTNRALIEGIRGIDNITIHDLYEKYPDFNIDISYEKDLLIQHDIIIWHHPLYWYSCPPLLKQWIDIVLEFNWAYGPKGDALSRKVILNAITAGGTEEVYCAEGKNNFTIREFLRPFEQTARLCRMYYLPPFAVMGTHRLTEEKLHTYVNQYQKLLRALQNDDLEMLSIDNYSYLNEAFTLLNKNEYDR